MADSNSRTLSVFDLSDSEKLQLVQDLWDDLAASPASVPITEWQKQELDRRETTRLAAPEPLQPWGDVRARIRARYGR